MEPSPKNAVPAPRGRGAATNPANRFARIDFSEDLEYLENDPDAVAARQGVATEYFVDDAKSVVSENDSPDIPFRYSLNPYRGCAHGCSYCFARPTHEYLDLSAGLDFETRIFVKERAPELFREWLGRDGYRPETVAMSGVTDCYQPIEPGHSRRKALRRPVRRTHAGKRRDRGPNRCLVPAVRETLRFEHHSATIDGRPLSPSAPRFWPTLALRIASEWAGKTR